MRFYLFLLVATVAALLQGCTPTEDAEDLNAGNGELYTLRATAGTSTRSALEGTSVRWGAGDAVGVFAGQNLNVRFANTSTSDLEEAEFEGTLKGRSEQVVAYYPYNKQVTVSASKLHITLPAEQPFASNKSFGTGLNPSVAEGDIRGLLTFKNLCGVIEVQLYGNSVEVQSIEFIPQHGAASGAGTVDLSGTPEERSLVMESVSTPKSVTLTGISQTLSETPASYYLVLPAGTYEGFTLVVTGSDGMRKEIASTKSLTVKRSVITKMTPLEIVSTSPVARRDTLWVRGINPPNERWEFIKEGGYDIDYMPAYAGCRWFDVDKQYQTDLPTNVIPGLFYSPTDYYMCWAATSSNLLHYFLEEYHDLLVQIPGYPNRDWRYWLVRKLGGNTDGHISEIMEEFKKHYPNQGGHAQHGVVDFLCGDYVMPGYLKEIFTADEVEKLIRTVGSLYLHTLSSEIRKIIQSGGTFSFSVITSGGGHAITGWGAIFSEKGLIEKVYITNSDDPAGLRTLKVISDGDVPLFEVSKTGKPWKINGLHLYSCPETLIRSKIKN